LEHKDASFQKLILGAQSILSTKSLDVILAKEFGSANSTSCSTWRENLELAVNAKRIDNANLCASISHANFIGGAAFLEEHEGTVGFDVEETNRVLPEVALRVSDPHQAKIAPTPAALFVAKEASFKALRGPRQPSVLSKVEILEWLNCPISPSFYKFRAGLKNESFQWFGVCFEFGSHTLGLSVFPHST
jgi:hypothetical protein